jgi:FKBP-type peptidyl-prolyl cis-trans isomerase
MFRWILSALFFSFLWSAQSDLINSPANQKPVTFSSEEFFDVFFRELFESTTAGYVLYGTKPLSLETYLNPAQEIPGTKEHYLSIKMQLAEKILPEIVAKKTPNEYIFRFLNNEFLIVNRDRFIKSVQENLLLFQYKFGIGITPEKMLEKLLSEENDFQSLFQESIALQGILLGYGTQNAITYEKGVHLRKTLLSHANCLLPYTLPTYPTSTQELLDKMSQNATWKQIKNEIQDLSHKQNSPDNHLKIPFSFHKNSDETRRLFDEYTKSQKIIERILKSKNFSKQIIEKLGVFPKKLSTISLHPEEENHLPSVVARFIQQAFAEELSSSFIAGMHAAEKGNVTSIIPEKLAFFDVLRRNHSDPEATENIKAMTEKNSFSCLIPNRLYIRMLRDGESSQAFNFHYKTLKANFLFEESDGKILGGTYQMAEPLEIQTTSLIPSLVHGMLGMKIGEIREVFLHPILIYGTDSAIGKRQSIKIHIELLELKDKLENEMPISLIPIDISHLKPNISSCSEYTKLQNEYFYYCGLRTWLHYKKANPDICLDTIVNELTLAPRVLTKEEQMTLLKLEWMIYSNSMFHFFLAHRASEATVN